MNLSPVGHPIWPPAGLGRAAPDHFPNGVGSAEPQPDSSVPTLPPDLEGDPQALQTTAAGRVENDGDSVRGVIRLLQEGHFKGVADVRLRINFYDELVAAGLQEAGPAMTDKVMALLQTVNGQIEELTSSGILTEEQLAEVAELQSAFNGSVNAAVDDLLNSDDGSAETLEAALQAAFDLLLASLSSLLGTRSETHAEGLRQVIEPMAVDPNGETVDPSSEQPEGTAAADPPEDGGETTDAQQFIDQLVDAFAAAFNDIASVSATTTLLPELSGPTGNGVAYWRFLAIYNELRGLGERVNAAPEGTLISVA